MGCKAGILLIEISLAVGEEEGREAVEIEFLGTMDVGCEVEILFVEFFFAVGEEEEEFEEDDEFSISARVRFVILGSLVLSEIGGKLELVSWNEELAFGFVFSALVIRLLLILI